MRSLPLLLATLSLGAGLHLRAAEDSSALMQRHNRALLAELKTYVAENPKADDIDTAYRNLLQTSMILGDPAEIGGALRADLARRLESGIFDEKNTAESLMLLTRITQQTGDKEGLKEVASLAEAFAKKKPGGLFDTVVEQITQVAGQLGPGDLPTLSGVNTNGEKVSLEAFRGKVVLLDFWATWCGPCRAEMPHLKEVYAKYKDKGFEIIGVSGDRTKEALTGFLEKEGITWNNLYDRDQEESILRAFQITAFPTMFLLDQQGRIVTSDVRGGRLEDQVLKLLESAPQPE